MAELIDLGTASELVRQRVRRNGSERRRLDDSMGYVLAESVLGPDDVPPFDKSLVDGFAIVASSLDGTRATQRLQVVEEVFAGQVPSRSIQPGQAARIMTGAPLPLGADAVVMREFARVDQDGEVELPTRQVHVGQHIMRRGAAHQAGRSVVQAGQRLRPVEIAVLAEAGRDTVDVVRRASVAAIQTGDELVPPNELPGPGQIRNSNGPLLDALIRQAGGTPVSLGIVRDVVDDLTSAVTTGLEHDMLLISGGVSAGDKDLVPGVLQDVGVECIFHKVNIRPGKPIWFGSFDDQGQQKLVFGLPGNPVSGLVGFLLLVAPTLAEVAGHGVGWPHDASLQHAELVDSFTLKGSRPAYWPGRFSDGQTRVRPLTWLGSADPFSLVQADCLASFAEGNRTYDAGERVPVLPLN